MMFHLPARARRSHPEPRHKRPKSPTERRAQPSSREANPSGVAREPGGEGGFGHPEPGCNLGLVRKHAHLQPTGAKPTQTRPQSWSRSSSGPTPASALAPWSSTTGGARRHATSRCRSHGSSTTTSSTRVSRRTSTSRTTSSQITDEDEDDE